MEESMVERMWYDDEFERVSSDATGSCNLMEVPMVGKELTWIGHKRRKLDRFLVEENWYNSHSDLKVIGFRRTILDHIPIMMANTCVNLGPRPFKMINVWLSKVDCIDLIQKELSISSKNELNLPDKLKRVKYALKNWNKESCGDLNKSVEGLIKRINELEDSGRSRVINYEIHEERLNCKIQLWDSLRAQEYLWRQKLRISWLKEGDRNSSFFHRVVKFRAKKGMI
ncbi:uncharacterized protein LOC120156226 [Hibiscus syriacus]|uniref:uncharacterized protein LOC120156226 n=1 Tax=Hibiscus syriacus TaxID=106335 RepID=UPI0019244EF6|nr:uncharacterized protein LOC120156226 [Hibiscus syriacus]